MQAISSQKPLRMWKRGIGCLYYLLQESISSEEKMKWKGEEKKIRG